MDRKQFIESSARWGLLGILAGIVGLLIRRKSIALNSDCDPKFCSSCNLKSSCTSAKKTSNIEHRTSNISNDG